MMPLGIRPNHLLNKLITTIDDGKSLQLVNQPDRKIKCYNSALGKGIPLFESGTVYYVKRSDLALALGLNDKSATHEQLHTELIWHMVQSASDENKEKHPVEPGAKEFLIGKYFIEEESLDESLKWFELSSQKDYLLGELALIEHNANTSSENGEALMKLSSILISSHGHDVELFLNTAKFDIDEIEMEGEPPFAAHKAAMQIFKRCETLAQRGHKTAIEVINQYISYHPRGAYAQSLLCIIENLLPLMNFFQKVSVINYLMILYETNPSVLPKLEELTFALLDETKAPCESSLIDALRLLTEAGNRKSRVKLKEVILDLENASSALFTFPSRASVENILTKEESHRFDANLFKLVDSCHLLPLGEYYKEFSQFDPAYGLECYLTFLKIAAPKDVRYFEELTRLALEGHKSAVQTLQELSERGDAVAEFHLRNVEFRQFLTPCQEAKYHSEEFKVCLKKVIVAHFKTGRVENQTKTFLCLYFIPAHLRFKVDTEAHSIHEIMNNPLHRRNILEGIVQAIEMETDPDFINAIAHPFYMEQFLAKDNEDLGKRAIARLAHIPLLAFYLLNNARFWRLANEDNFRILEMNALNYAYSGQAQELFPLYQHVLTKIREKKPPFTFEMLSRLIIQGAKKHKTVQFLDPLWELAIAGHSAAQDALQELSKEDPDRFNHYQNAYRLHQWAQEQSVETLKTMDEPPAILHKLSIAEIDKLLNYYEGYTGVSDLLEPPADNIEYYFDLFQYLAIQAAKLHSHYVKTLIRIAGGNSDALPILKKWALNGNQDAIHYFKQDAFNHFIAQCSLQTLRSESFDKAFEQALGDRLTIPPVMRIFYMMPPNLRLSWLEDSLDPHQPIKISLTDFPFKRHPILREGMVEHVSGKLSQGLPPNLLHYLASFVTRYHALFAIHDEHPLFQKAIEVQSALVAPGPKNAVNIFNKQLAMRNQPSLFIPPLMEVEGKNVRFNLPVIQALVAQMSIPRSLLHKDVTWDAWAQLIQRIDQKSVDPEVQRLIADESTGGWDVLKSTCLSDNAFFRARIEFAADPVPVNYAQLNAVLHKIINMNGEGSPLSEKELLLIKFAESVKNCPGGKFEGVSLYYTRGLEPHEKFPIEITGESDKAKARAKAVLAEEYQNTIVQSFSDSDALMQELTSQRHVQQISHQAIYLKNLIAHIVGLQHNLHFDTHTQTLYETLINRPREEVLGIFFKHYTPHTLVDHVHAWMNRDSETEGRKNWEKIFQLVTPGEDDMEWDEETLVPTTANKTYARKILEEAGYLIGG